MVKYIDVEAIENDNKDLSMSELKYKLFKLNNELATISDGNLDYEDMIKGSDILAQIVVIDNIIQKKLQS